MTQLWSDLYCLAIDEKRYGEAVYARYHMDGLATDGVYTMDNIIVINEIKRDASDYAAHNLEMFAAAIIL